MKKPDLRTLDLNLLKALAALLDERNVTRAPARSSNSQVLRAAWVAVADMMLLGGLLDRPA
nr:hypothetical protein [Herbaspirillum sp. C9C3]